MNVNKYDVIIAGSGFTGSILARKLAEERNLKVCVVEKRAQISGNMYDEYDDGILIQRYGPHVFHTDRDDLYNYLLRFCKMDDYKPECKVVIDGKEMTTPFNFESIDLLYSMEEGESLKNKLKDCFGQRESVSVLELLENEEEDVRNYGELLFKKDYEPYNMKQWGISADQIDRSVIERHPVFLSYRKILHMQKYTVIPVGGFYKLFHNMLDHPNIDIILNQDINDLIDICWSEKRIKINGENWNKILIYTGPIDELCDYQFGELPYRTLNIVYQKMNIKSYQESPVLVYPQAEGYTRIIEYTKMPFQDVGEKTIVATEYPVQYNKNSDNCSEPYYPIINDKNLLLYKRYKDIVRSVPNLYVCGRLGDYKYYDMDKAMERALQVFEEISMKNGWK